MQKRDRNSTIAAVATPPGEGGIAIIRISGDHAIPIADACFRGKRRLADVSSHTVHYGEFRDTANELSDTVLATVFRKPHSYTGEDTVEISCHGGHVGSQKILKAVIDSGARLAAPGEFTERAFLNGRMDLAQAEAVADLIQAKSERAHRIAMAQLEGRLSQLVTGLRDRLLSICSLLELELDFAEEGIELAKRAEIVESIDGAIGQLDRLRRAYRSGKVIREGAKVVLTGRPNAGKSSLLNILLQENRAIVSDVPGTTRDVIEESIIIDGVLFRLVDTAGLRSPEDPIEEEGIRRTDEQLRSADLILCIIDSTAVIDRTDEWMSRLQAVAGEHKIHLLRVFNKTDLLHSSSALPAGKGDEDICQISCLSHEGIDSLKKKILALALPSYDAAVSDLAIHNARQMTAVVNALGSLKSAAETLTQGLSSEFAAVDLRAAMDSLGEIIGLATPDDVLNTIFDRFCIGK